MTSRLPHAVLALLFLSASARAQTIHPPAQAAASPRRIAQVQALATPPNVPGPASTVGPNPAPIPVNSPATVKLQYPNSDVQDVLRIYEALTGKRVITDNFVQGKVNINIVGDVPREEAIKIIETNLLMNGFALVPAEPDLIKVIGTNKNPRGAGIPIVSDPSEIPPGERVISYVFKLRFADPTELQAALTQYLAGGSPSPYSSILALPKSSSLLVTESTTVIRSIGKIIDQIDVEPAEVVSEFIPLQRADATKVVDMLKDIFEKGDQTRGVAPGAVRTVRGVPNPNIPQPQGEADFTVTGLSEESIIQGKIKIAADVRTNRIHVITRPVNLPFVRRLISEFDANTQFAKPVTRPLRYISASDVLPVLVQALTEPGQNEQGTAGGTAGPQAGPTPQRATNPTATNPYNAAQGSTASDSNLNISEELSTQPVDTAPKSATIGNTKLIADQRANTIIILGNREVVVRVEKILDEMDVKAPQVTLSTVIGELTLNNEEEFGVDYFLNFKHIGGGSGGIGAGVDNSAVPATGIVDPSLLKFTKLAAAAAASGGTNIYLSAGDTLKSIVHALDSTGRFKTISRPTVFTSNNKKAIIASGSEVPVPVNTLTNAGVTTNNNIAAVQSSIEFKKVALQLEVVPLINSEKEVSLDILQKIDSLSNERTNIGGNIVPTINTRYIRTNVSAPNCSTIVLGGLIQDEKTLDKSGVPYLSKLPILGAIFRSTSKARKRTELIILMRPEVSLTKLDLYRLRQKSEDKTHFGPELEQDDCPDCPKPGDGKQLPPPDVPSAKGL
ncbi:MAG: secretin N-terminal domain-containing protein [Chthoniobacterales bacterium]